MIYFEKNIILITFTTIIIFSIALHWRVFKLDLMSFHVWKQTETQSIINNFYREDFNILHPRMNARGDGTGILRMGFPIMEWLFACFYKLFGDDVMISRILTFIIGLFSIAGIFKLIKKIFDHEHIALIGTWCFAFSPSFFYYTVNPMPDNFALCCSIWGLAFFFSYIKNGIKSEWILSGFFLGLGTLVKLPFIIYYIIPFIFFLQIMFKTGFRRDLVRSVFVYLISILPPVLWYVWVIPEWHGNGITTGMLTNNKPIIALIDIIRHNLISTLPELLVNYGSMLFFLAGLYFIIKNNIYKRDIFLPFFLCGLSLIFYFLFEMNMIEKVHDYYLFSFLPFLFLIVAYGANNLIQLQNKWLYYFVFLLFCILPLTTYLRMKARWKPESPGFNKELLLYKEDLRKLVGKDDLVIVGNDISSAIFLYYIDKKGWVFNNDILDPSTLQEMIIKGAKYFYSDSRKIDENMTMRKFFKDELFNKGSIRVYSLQKAE